MGLKRNRVSRAVKKTRRAGVEARGRPPRQYPSSTRFAKTPPRHRHCDVSDQLLKTITHHKSPLLSPGLRLWGLCESVHTPPPPHHLHLLLLRNRPTSKMCLSALSGLTQGLFFPLPLSNFIILPAAAEGRVCCGARRALLPTYFVHFDLFGHFKGGKGPSTKHHTMSNITFFNSI